MRTDVISFVSVSENRKMVVRALFEYPERQWSCSAMEDVAKLPHATAFRALSGLMHFGVLKGVKVNRKDVLYELVRSPLSEELRKLININKITAMKIAAIFVNKIKSKSLHSAVLYGSGASGNMKPESDIDILVILEKHDSILEKKILDIAGAVSSKLNRAISATIMDLKEESQEKNSQFIGSVRSNMEVIYGKKPF